MTGRLWLPVLALLTGIGTAGCAHHDYVYAPAVIKVVDAETREPVAGAHVRVRYSGALFSGFNAPDEADLTCGLDGSVATRLTTFRANATAPELEASAPGYEGVITGDPTPLTVRTLEAIDEGREPIRTVRATLELWRAPPPRVVVTVPDDYRGYVRLTLPSGPMPPTRYRPEEPLPVAHQRRFVVAASADGACRLPDRRVFSEGPWQLEQMVEFRRNNGATLLCAPVFPRVDPGAITKAWDFGSVTYLIADGREAAAELRRLQPNGVYDEVAHEAWTRRAARGPLP